MPVRSLGHNYAQVQHGNADDSPSQELHAEHFISQLKCTAGSDEVIDDLIAAFSKLPNAGLSRHKHDCTQGTKWLVLCYYMHSLNKPESRHKHNCTQGRKWLVLCYNMHS